MVFSQKLVNRYKQLKEAVPDCLLLMQVGAFMQVMDQDARAVSQVTGLKLQMAGDVDAPVVLRVSQIRAGCLRGQTGARGALHSHRVAGRAERASGQRGDLEIPAIMHRKRGGTDMVRKVITHVKHPLLIAGIVLCLVGVAYAATGNIDPDDKWA